MIGRLSPLLWLGLLLATVGPGPAQAAHTPEQQGVLMELRSAMAGRDLPALKKLVATGTALKGEVAYDEEFNRLELLAQYIEAFWNAVDKGAAAALNQNELDVDGTICAVVDYDRRLFVIRTAGENKRYTLRTIPPKLALVLSQFQLPKDKAENKVCFGAFLAMDGKGDRRLARQYWQEAATGGGDVKTLLPELEIELASPPLELPDLTPAQRLPLQSAQWMLRTRQGEKTVREPLGKAGALNDAGRLEIAPASDASTQLINKNRISGDFSCLAFLDGVVKDQPFGLFPAVPSEESITVPLPAGRVKIELARKKGLYYCRINDRDVELKPAAKSAERVAGYLGVGLVEKQGLVVALFDLNTR